MLYNFVQWNVSIFRILPKSKYNCRFQHRYRERERPYYLTNTARTGVELFLAFIPSSLYRGLFAIEGLSKGYAQRTQFWLWNKKEPKLCNSKLKDAQEQSESLRDDDEVSREFRVSREQNRALPDAQTCDLPALRQPRLSHAEARSHQHV